MTLVDTARNLQAPGNLGPWSMASLLWVKGFKRQVAAKKAIKGEFRWAWAGSFFPTYK
jgi:hypothetical protein